MLFTLDTVFPKPADPRTGGVAPIDFTQRLIDNTHPRILRLILQHPKLMQIYYNELPPLLLSPRPLYRALKQLYQKGISQYSRSRRDKISTVGTCTTDLANHP